VACCARRSGRPPVVDRDAEGGARFTAPASRRAHHGAQVARYPRGAQCGQSNPRRIRKSPIDDAPLRSLPQGQEATNDLNDADVLHLHLQPHHLQSLDLKRRPERDFGIVDEGKRPTIRQRACDLCTSPLDRHGIRDIDVDALQTTPRRRHSSEVGELLIAGAIRAGEHGVPKCTRCMAVAWPMPDVAPVTRTAVLLTVFRLLLSP
jgi:hypothetical protein